eukprot:TRINITY_DN5769_c0_g1_i1.p1 TRINITY_DN5769_c0_g1~~TRINITY_DN5769_c0_g1_i1.p1  ORF type:complete len:238 (+),score=66.79 TRINITY_DN5769_c0_g1_i1:50-763(+)
MTTPFFRILVKETLPKWVKNSLLVATSAIVGDVLCQGILVYNNHNDPHPPLPYRTPSTNKESTMSVFMKEWDVKRTMIMATVGFFVTAPMSLFFHQFLEKTFPGNAWKQIAKKMVCNWGFAPITTSIVFAAVAFLKGKSISEAGSKIEADLMPTMLTGMMYWPFIGMMNFRFVPLEKRPLVGSIASAVWNIYMSNQTNKEFVLFLTPHNTYTTHTHTTHTQHTTHNTYTTHTTYTTH